MKSRSLLWAFFVLSAPLAAQMQSGVDVLGMHNLGGAGTSPIKGQRSDACNYCHAPHSGLPRGGWAQRGLWNQTLTKATYQVYTSSTEANTSAGHPPPLGYVSNQCLSCHDGTVAVGSTIAYGQIPMAGSMTPSDVFGTDLRSSHPFSMVTPLKDAVHLVASIVASGKTADPTHRVRLIHGDVECTSCHNPHVQGIDPVAQKFLVVDSSKGGLCLDCHDPNRQMTNKVNPLAGWQASAHAVSAAQILSSAGIGSYQTLAANGCNSCHAPHNAVGAARLTRGVDQDACKSCHNGANVSPSPANVYADYAKTYTHPFPASPNVTPLPSNTHDAAEAVLLPSTNRHATCADCHNTHAAQSISTFPAPPTIRISQTGIAGIATDGSTVLSTATNQYENCLRCHGQSAPIAPATGYGYLPVRAIAVANPSNVIPEFTLSGVSSHPVMHPSNSQLPQPSLRSYALHLDGGTDSTRSLPGSIQIFCTDCHNSDTNREFGGNGASGPHGSAYPHLLERNYEFSRVGADGPGSTILNLYTTNINGTFSAAAPYALCAKCHDIDILRTSNQSWSGHAYHINSGFSCSVCHTAHGIGAASSTIKGGTSLINFDAAVVAPNNGAISYDPSRGYCGLVCHNAAHDGATGVVTDTRRRQIGRPILRK